ncbi:TPA: DNA topoisomerase 3 [Legionella pneumophila]
MRLFIAEKPSVAKAIAQTLGISARQDGYIECGTDCVTWCFGHLLELAEPDVYTSDEVPRHPKTDKKIWREDDLPILPSHWIVQPKTEAKKQLAVIERLLKKADVIVNAGDSDREGQLLIDEILEHFNTQKPSLRFWVSAHDATSMARGLSSLKDNALFKGLGASAKARSRADWLIGMNLSRAYTLSAKRGGAPALLTVGRVQTPTLALVVGRDKDIEHFKPQAYHTIKAVFSIGAHAFMAHWQADDNQEGLDSEGRLVNTACANELVSRVSGQNGVITRVTEASKTQEHPKAYSLSDITLVACNRWGYSAMEVLTACQSLYETHKLTSYPRTDCAYLPESQHSDAPEILAALKHVNPCLVSLIERCDVSIRSKTWDDSKVTAHYGIIPTRHQGDRSALSAIEQNLYDLVVRAYLAQFYPLHEYLSTQVALDVDGVLFNTRGKTITQNGWRELYAPQETDESDDEDCVQKLPPMAIHDGVVCQKATRIDAQTKPPARFTEGTLQRAMEQIHKHVEDKDSKKILKEGDGIGTSATRATIISELKRRGYLESKGRAIISTPLGRSVIDALPETVKSPVLTAMYERILKQMELDATLFTGFMDKQIQWVKEHVARASQNAICITGAQSSVLISTQFMCPSCNKGLCRRKGTKGYWWSCSGYPQCSASFSDSKGRPNFNPKTTKQTKEPV